MTTNSAHFNEWPKNALQMSDLPFSEREPRSPRAFKQAFSYAYDSVDLNETATMKLIKQQLKGSAELGIKTWLWL